MEMETQKKDWMLLNWSSTKLTYAPKLSCSRDCCIGGHCSLMVKVQCSLHPRHISSIREKWSEVILFAIWVPLFTRVTPRRKHWWARILLVWLAFNQNSSLKLKQIVSDWNANQIHEHTHIYSLLFSSLINQPHDLFSKRNNWQF